MALFYETGAPFSTGSAGYYYRPASPSDVLDRIQVNIKIDGTSTLAVVDTVAPWLVCEPELAELIGFDSDHSLGIEKLNVRGFSLSGHLHRVNLTMQATSGESVTIEATAFVPTGQSAENWTERLKLPTFLGMHLCLEGLLFAIDPFERRFYFGDPNHASELHNKSR